MLKTPVSMLQELTVQKKLAIPDYEIQGTGQSHCMSFTCHVKTGDYRATGEGVTKKDAKHAAARNMLNMFGIALEQSPLMPSKTNKSDGPMINYIGKLNEFCYGKKHPQPTYTDSVTVQNAQFCMVCQFNNLEAKGYGLNKKDAKQEAAKNMLLQIKENGFIGLPAEAASEKLVVDNKLCEQVVDTYTELMKSVKIYHKDCDNNQLEAINPEINISTWDELTALLQEQGYRYELTTFQSYPLILSLKINELVLMNCGTTKEEIRNKFVVDTVNMLRNGMDFSKPLINL